MVYQRVSKPSSGNSQIHKKDSLSSVPAMPVQAKSDSASPRDQEMPIYTPTAANWATNNNLMRSLSGTQEIQRQEDLDKEDREPIQAKLTIGQVGDKYEQEADQTAQRVVSQINSPQGQSLQREEKPEDELQKKPMVQRKSAGGGIDATSELEASIQQAKGGGQPLADNIRKPMEQAFGADFSGVNIHTDAQSDQLNQSLQAKAFTTGQDVFFRQGAYDPGSRGGQELIAHELTHVVQQNGGANVLGAKLAKEEPALADSAIYISQVGAKSPIQRTVDTEDEYLLDQPIPQDLNLDQTLSPESFVEPINEEMNTTFLHNRKMEREAELLKMGGGTARDKDKAKGVVNLENLKNRPLSNFVEELKNLVEEAPEYEEQGQDQEAPPMESNDEGSYLTTQLGSEYWDEYQIGTTYYPDSLDPYKLDISEGKLKQGVQEVDTIKSRRIVQTDGSKNGRFIYAMDSKGDFTVGDEGVENKKHGKNFHHSSLSQGDDVAGAGELQVRNGKLEAITDRSGHYQPASALTHQVAKNLESKGIAMEQVGIELEDKGQGQGNLDLSAVEFLAYEPEMNQAIEAYKQFEAENPQADDRKKQAMKRKLLNAPEQKIRESHDKKNSVLDELTSKTAGRKTEYEKNTVEGEGKAKLPTIQALKKCYQIINAKKTIIPAKRLEQILLPEIDCTEEEKAALSKVPEETLEKATQEAIAIKNFLSEIKQYDFAPFRK